MRLQRQQNVQAFLLALSVMMMLGRYFLLEETLRFLLPSVLIDSKNTTLGTRNETTDTIVSQQLQEKNNHSTIANNSTLNIPTSTDERLWIAMHAWGNPDLLHLALRSVVQQERIGFHKIVVVVFEDFSNNMFQEEDMQQFLR